MKMLPLNEALQACAEIGYQHVEFSLNEGYSTAPDVFTSAARRDAAEQLRKLRLGLPCLMVNISLTADAQAHAANLALIGKAGGLAHELNADQPPILETILGGSPAKWEEQKQGMAQKLHDWAEAAEQAKAVIAIKAHVASAANSPERLLWLLSEVKSPAIQAAYDYSHFELQGIGMEASLRALLPRTRFIHVKDSAGDAAKFQFLLPGEGRTDYVKLFSLLKMHGYTGPVCVEVSGQIFNKPGYDPVAAARQSFTVLSDALEKSKTS
ncbi:MAG: sugar phosphate isomerase/epimerase family protein [Pirellulales bacterium]